MSVTGARAHSRPFVFHAGIFLVSFAALLLEISYTRFISFKLFYFYTYLIIGFALLGIGSGGVLVAVLPSLRVADLGTVWTRGSLLAAVAVVLGYGVVCRMPMDTFAFWSDPTQPFRLLAVCLALFLAFLVVGVMIAALFAQRTEEVNSLYCADLLGAGLGCAAVVPAIKVLGPPSCIMLAAAGFALTGCLVALGSSRRQLLLTNAFVAAALVLTAFAPELLPQPVTDKTKTVQLGTGARPLFSRWSPVFRVDVTESLNDRDVRIIHHDGLWGSTLHRFDGNPGGLTRFEADDRAFPFKVLGAPPKRVLIIGAAGGHEILASLYFGAEHVTAVELNPVTVSLLTDVFADYSGHIATNPRVNLVNDEGRSFLARDDERYDLIFFVAPDSYAAMNAATAGAFVLSESYLYTTEMILQSLAHLTPTGIVCMQFGELAYDQKPNRTIRYVATARDAMRRMSVGEFAKNVMVATRATYMHVSTILMRASPFAEVEHARFREAIAATPGARLRYAGRSYEDGAVTKAIELPDASLEEWIDTYPYNVAAVTDDSPFFWHFARFRSVIGGLGTRLEKGDNENAMGERILIGMLMVSAFAAAAFLLLPFVVVRETWLALPRKAAATAYFGALGLGFMFFEISLIQKLTLFLGYPTYSLTATLMSLLVFTGIGSLLAAGYTTNDRRDLLIVVAGLAVLTLFYCIGLRRVVDVTMSQALPVRVALTICMIAPLGLCLGAFMPSGLRTVAGLTEHEREYVAWAWAINGFFAVLGSVLTTILSMAYGFQAVLQLALVTYVFAYAAFLVLKRPLET